MNTALKLLMLAALIGFTHATATPPVGDKDAPAKAPPLKADDKPIVVPFELLDSRHMAMQVKVNGKGPYRVIFDTGAPMNIVNNKVAKAAGLLAKDDKPAPLFGASMNAKTIKTFEVGGLKLEGMQSMVMDHPTVEAIGKAVGPVEGLIGFPFFARYKMTIDYEKKEMTLVPNGFVPRDTMQNMMNKIMGAGGGKKPDPAVIAPSGVWGFTVDKDANDEGAGVKVTGVLASSPAAAGGLKDGDRLLTLDGRWTDTIGDTFIAARAVKPGVPVVLVVKRDGKDVKLTVTPVKGL